MSDNRPPTDEVPLPRFEARPGVYTLGTCEPTTFGDRPPSTDGLDFEILAVAAAGAPMLREAALNLVRSLQFADGPPMPDAAAGTLQVAIAAHALGMLAEHLGNGPDEAAALHALIERGRRYYRDPLDVGAL